MTGARTIFVTGATGFVGSALVAGLAGDERYQVRAAVHGHEKKFPEQVETVNGFDLAQPGDWAGMLQGVDSVIHAAGRVHVMHETAGNALAEYYRINVQGTQSLAQQAAAAGVRRFIFLSTVKVNGEETFDQPFTAKDQPQPLDAYGISKWEAEQVLSQIGAATGMEIVILRLPLVYGMGVGGNFAAMLRMLHKPWPLPLAAVRHNRRSLVALDNVIDLTIMCIDHPAAANCAWMISDGEDVSTADLLRRTAVAMGREVRLFPFPSGLLRLGAVLIGKSEVARRLLGSLQVDMSETQRLLGWNPPVSLEEGLRRAVGKRGVRAVP
ncbi:MAG: dTDP-L-rhamnose 4-epimerase [Betaproteobacteria bacterium ADurb.Bin341]|nr:MAG: dTDP-L-rhamnose 4-epimerase [Betaproteobacteria bacterium ADurb.Bin341]